MSKGWVSTSKVQLVLAGEPPPASMLPSLTTRDWLMDFSLMVALAGPKSLSAVPTNLSQVSTLESQSVYWLDGTPAYGPAPAGLALAHMVFTTPNGVKATGRSLKAVPVLAPVRTAW